MPVFILRFGNAEWVCESFRQAMRSAATLVFPDETLREQVRKMDRFPGLNQFGVAGTFYQCIRLKASRNGLKRFTIAEHATGLPPGKPTLRYLFDLAEGVDPSFEVQVALWELMDEAQPSVEIAQQIADRLRNDVRHGLGRDRCKVGAEQLVSTMRELEKKMGGIPVVPRFGFATALLDSLPELTAAAFLQIAGDVLAARTIGFTVIDQ